MTANQDGPDYATYSLAELVEARQSIDEYRYPDRVQRLDRLIVTRREKLAVDQAPRGEEPSVEQEPPTYARATVELLGFVAVCIFIAMTWENIDSKLVAALLVIMALTSFLRAGHTLTLVRRHRARSAATCRYCFTPIGDAKQRCVSCGAPLPAELQEVRGAGRSSAPSGDGA